MTTAPSKRAMSTRATSILILLATSAALGLPSPASAGSYVHLSCPGGVRSDAGAGWFAFNSEVVPSNSAADDFCASSGLGAQVTPHSDFPIAPGGGVGWSYMPPWGTSVRGFEADVQGWGTTVNGATGQWALLSGTDTLATITDNGIWPKRHVTASGLAPRDLKFMLRCATTSARCATHWQIGWSSVSNIAVTLLEGVTPTATAATGSLTTDSVLAESASVAFSASDVGSGVAEVRLLADGQLVHTAPVAGGTCVPVGRGASGAVYAAPKPCPDSARVDATLPVTGIKDGRTRIDVEVADAAGNTTTVYSASKVVANRPPQNQSLPSFSRIDLAASPVVGEQMRSTSGTWTGPNLSYSYEWQRCDPAGEVCNPIAGASGPTYTPTHADAGSRLRVAVTAHNVVGVTSFSATTGLVRSASGAPVLLPGQANGEGGGGSSCSGSKVVIATPGARSGVVRVGFGKDRKIKVTLTCADDGRPISGATLVSATQIAGEEAPRGGYVQTDSAGAAVVRVDGRHSRTISLTYRLRGGDAVAAAQARVSVRVKVPVSLRVRKLSRFTTSFRGKLSGGHVPARGVSVQLQWQDGQRWRPVATLKTSRTGVFKYRYRFSAAAAGNRYRFRAVVLPGQLDYPFVPSRSRARSVTPG